MAINSRSGGDLKPYSLEHIDNQSFDQEFQVKVVEILGYNPSTNSLERINTVNGVISAFTPSTITNGKKSVTTAGTRVALATSTAVQGVVIQAVQANTGIIYVGNSTVSSSNGYELVGGQAIGISIDDLSKIYIDSSVNGEGVTYIGS